MTFAPGVKKKGGRIKGVANRKTQELRAMMEAEAEGIPLPVLLVRWAKKAMKAGEIPAAIGALAQAARYGYAVPKPQEEDRNQGPVRVLVVRAANAPGTLTPPVVDDEPAKCIEAQAEVVPNA